MNDDKMILSGDDVGAPEEMLDTASVISAAYNAALHEITTLMAATDNFIDALDFAKAHSASTIKHEHKKFIYYKTEKTDSSDIVLSFPNTKVMEMHTPGELRVTLGANNKVETNVAAGNKGEMPEAPDSKIFAAAAMNTRLASALTNEPQQTLEESFNKHLNHPRRFDLMTLTDSTRALMDIGQRAALHGQIVCTPVARRAAITAEQQALLEGVRRGTHQMVQARKAARELISAFKLMEKLSEGYLDFCAQKMPGRSDVQMILRSMELDESDLLFDTAYFKVNAGGMIKITNTPNGDADYTHDALKQSDIDGIIIKYAKMAVFGGKIPEGTTVDKETLATLAPALQAVYKGIALATNEKALARAAAYFIEDGFRDLEQRLPGLIKCKAAPYTGSSDMAWTVTVKDKPPFDVRVTKETAIEIDKQHINFTMDAAPRKQALKILTDAVMFRLTRAKTRTLSPATL